MSNSFSHGSLGQWFYNLYCKNQSSAAIWAAAGTVDIAANTRFAIAVTATGGATGFVTDCAVGDLVTMDVGLETSTIVEIISETAIYTTALSGAGSYANNEALTVTRAGTPVFTGTVGVTNPATIYCHDLDGDFIDGGVCVGDVVTMTIGGETAAVQEVHETFLKTAALSAAGTYANAEAFTIANAVAKIMRVVIPRSAGEQSHIRRINFVSDLVTAKIQVFNTSSDTPIYSQKVGTTIFTVQPEIAPQDATTPLLVELDYTTITNLGLTCIYETR